MKDPHYGRMCFKLKPSELYILSRGKGFGLSASAFSTTKNVVLLGLYHIHRLARIATPDGYLTTYIPGIMWNHSLYHYMKNNPQ